MRRLFWQMLISLDGFMEAADPNENWYAPGPEFQDYVLEMLETIDAILLGRLTYELFARYWPSATDPEAPKMNRLAKLVFSRTLRSVNWSNSSLAGGDPAAKIAELKARPGKDLAIFGSADLAASIMPLGLIDEYRVFTAPVVLGGGKPMFRVEQPKIGLKLSKVRTLDAGLVFLTYHPA